MMPPCRNIHRFRHEWTFGCPSDKLGHLVIQHHGKTYFVHRIIARAFIENPDNLPTVDHIDRNPTNNRVGNLRWATHKMQSDNHGKVLNRTDYGIRNCDDRKAYQRAWCAAHREEYNARCRAYRKSHREEHKAYKKAYWAAKAAKMRAQGFYYTKGPDGKYGWYAAKKKAKEG